MKNYFMVLLTALFASAMAMASDEQTLSIQNNIRITKKLEGDEEVYRAHYIAHGDKFQFKMRMEPGRIEQSLPNGVKFYARKHNSSQWCPKDQYPNGFCQPLERQLVQYLQATIHNQ